MRWLGLVLFLLFVVAAAVFATLNAELVAVDFYFTKAELPLALNLAGALLIGLLLGVLVILPTLLGARRRTRAVRREMKALEEELKNLRALPLRDGV
ncbi:MAG: lipopolysaccharide assembly protein LapA domain-containing protein [Gammaproteobacteria bacterium]|nr:lipopolysaccharide assembly protein LapA domain-containing protein [Gammaproteobacteria bacterium]